MPDDRKAQDVSNMGEISCWETKVMVLLRHTFRNTVGVYITIRMTLSDVSQPTVLEERA